MSDVWVLVQTPDNKIFPAMFYFGQSGTALGAWKKYTDISGSKIFPEDFETIINCSPFDFFLMMKNYTC